MWFVLLVSEDFFFLFQRESAQTCFGVINVPFIYDSVEKDHKLPWQLLIIWMETLDADVASIYSFPFG